jgi:hypothetical protein
MKSIKWWRTSYKTPTYLKESLGHASIATTDLYLSRSEDEDVVVMHIILMEGIL